MFKENINEKNRQTWLMSVLSALPAGTKILDAGAGELQNRKYCEHLDYVSQDFCQYQGGDGAPNEGLQIQRWNTSQIDIVSDICSIPLPNASFGAILCSEVLEHVPDPASALDEFARLLEPGGKLILTAPFASLVHMAPYYYCSGFSKYWYEYHLVKRGFRIETLTANGDWYALLLQEIKRMGSMERQRGNWVWPLAYAYAVLGVIYFKVRKEKRAEDVGCYGWHCVAVKS